MNNIQYVIGYVDSYDRVIYKVVKPGDINNSHTMIWTGKVAAHGKFRWSPDKPNHLNTYNEDIDDENLWKIREIIEKEVANAVK